MLQLEVLIRELLSIDGLAPGSIVVGEISPLENKHNTTTIICVEYLWIFWVQLQV